jgi:hypothetical protein
VSVAGDRRTNERGQDEVGVVDAQRSDPDIGVDGVVELARGGGQRSRRRLPHPEREQRHVDEAHARDREQHPPTRDQSDERRTQGQAAQYGQDRCRDLAHRAGDQLGHERDRNCGEYE